MRARIPGSRAWRPRPAAVRLVIASVILFSGSAWAAAPKGAADTTPDGNWTTKRIFDVFRNESRCVVETPATTMDDGRSPTKVFLRVDGRSLTVMTQSNVDIGADVGVRVDDNKLIRPDKIFLDQNLLFETSSAQIIEQFKAGLVAEAHLRFWPTWPDKGLKTVRFSLIGFTRAYARLPGC